MDPTPAPPQTADAPAFPGRRVFAILLAWNALWWALVGVFIAPRLPGGWLFLLAACALAVAPALVLGRIIRGALYPGAAVRLWLLRPFWYVQLALPIVGLVGLAGALGGFAFGAWRTAGAWAVTGALVAYVAFILVGYWGSRRLVVRHYDAVFPEIHEGLDGLRIAQLSDLHVGPHTSRRHIERIRAVVRTARPDLIAYTGDQVDDHDHDVHGFVAAFGDLRAPLGVYAIPGNHDIYAGWNGVRQGMEKAGMTVLVNTAITLVHDGASLTIAGTGDPAGRQWAAEGGAEAAPDIPRTLAAIPPDAFTIALVHNPALWPQVAQGGVHLTLSGHTHHGQLSIPLLNWCLATPFLDHAMGWHQQAGARLFINPGTNYWGIPLRIGAWPEVSIITLRKAAKKPTKR